MSFSEAVRSVFSQYATFSGRARRSEYWYFYLFTLIVVIVLAIILAATGGTDMDDMSGGATAVYVVAGLFSLAILLPTLAVSVRRLHDQDKSGFFWFLGLIPFVGGIIMIVLYALPGTVGPNRFGLDPKGAQAPAYPAA